MNPIIFDFSNQQINNLPQPVLSQTGVSPESLKAAECLLKTDGDQFFIEKPKQILAEILDEIDFAALVRSKIKEIENKAGLKSLALQRLEKNAHKKGWL